MDGSILLWIQNHLRNDFLTTILSRITGLGDSGWFWLLLGFLLLAAAILKQYTNKRTGTAENPLLRPALACLLAMLLSFLIGNLFLKNIIARTRPYDAISDLIVLTRKPGDYSFPSGHTSFSFSAAVALLLTAPRKARWLTLILVLLATLIGFSRIYLGVHYPTDVLAGLLLGCLCAYAAARITEKKENCHEIFIRQKGDKV